VKLQNKIIELLKKYGSLSTTKIAKLLNRSPSTVLYSLRALKDKGIVEDEYYFLESKRTNWKSWIRIWRLKHGKS